MSNHEDFQPRSEEEEKWVNYYNDLSDKISERIKSEAEEDRLSILKISNPSDLSLMNLFLRALKKEDYETCAVAKTLLLERGFVIPS